MDRDKRPDDAGDEPRPADGPLTQLVDDRNDRSRRRPVQSELPGQPAAKPTGRDDYAEGTSEHDDDRET